MTRFDNQVETPLTLYLNQYALVMRFPELYKYQISVSPEIIGDPKD
jgi:hypothetical protein